VTEPIVDAAPALDFDLKSLPKVSLHDHLDGGLRPATIIDLAEAVGHTLPSTDPTALGEWFRESANSGSLVRYLETFDHTIAVMQTKEGLFRVGKEFVEDLADDGVVYGEVRWAPEQHLQKGLTLDEVVEAVRIAEDIMVEFDSDDADEDEDNIGLVTLGNLASWVRDRGIPLEICPSSNLQTGAIAGFGEGIESHPLDMLYQLGFNVTINTDNRLMSGVTLTDEFELLVDTFDYDLDDLLELTLNAAEAAFLPLEEKEALVEYINEAYADLG